MSKFRAVMTAVAMAAALTASQAMAADVPALVPGKPAGVHTAQGHHSNLLLIAGVATVLVVGVVVGVATSNNSSCGSACSTPTTSS